MSKCDLKSLTLEQICSSVLRNLISDLSGLEHRKDADVYRDLQRFDKYVGIHGLEFMTVKMPALAKSMDLALATDGKLTIRGFVTCGKSPVWLHDLWRRVFDAEGCLLEHPSPSAIRTLRQILYLFYKLELPFSEDVIQTKLDAFVELDGSLPLPDEDVKLSPETRAVVDAARMLIGRVFENWEESPTGFPFDPLDIVPRHGPGSVATGEWPHTKMRFARYFSEIDEEYPYGDYFYLNHSHVAYYDPWMKRLEVCDDGFATLVLVPKDSRGPRTISMEPLEFQWIQQGLGIAIRDWLERHRLTRGYVNFTNQDVNRDLALYASAFPGSFDTLDMSDASDRVSLWLVRQLFPPDLMRKLEACRSRGTTLPDGRRLGLRKFAPMGSALCFPVEALVFWALASAVLDKRSCLSRRFSPAQDIYVYGDDLIVPHGTLDTLKPVFRELHLEFNESKCCTGKFFRESCGVDALLAEDVTPIRIKHVPVHRDRPSDLVSCCAYASAFADKGCSATAEYLYSCVERLTGTLPMDATNSLPLARRVSDGITAAIWNSRFPLRLNEALQRLEYKTQQPKPIDYEIGAYSWSELHRIMQGKQAEQDCEARSTISVIEFLRNDDSPQRGQYTTPRALVMRDTWVGLH